MTGPGSHFYIDSERQTAEIHDCGTVLRNLRSLVPDGLVGGIEWERLAIRADGLSASVLGLEFRLGDPTPNADLLLGFVPGSRAEQAHIRRGQETPPGSPEAVLADYFARIRGVEFPEAALITRTILEVDGLQQVGWLGPTEMVASTLAAINNQCERLAIQLEVSSRGVLPRLGLEVYVLPGQSHGFADWSATANPDQWRPILSRLENAGWCLPQKARSLLAFPGREHIFDDGIFLVHKGINHIKISIEAGQACTAKAYAGMLFVPVNT